MAPVVTRLITIHVSGQMDSTHTKFILIKMMHYSLKSSEMDLDATEQSSPVWRWRIEGISLFFFFFFFFCLFLLFFPKVDSGAQTVSWHNLFETKHNILGSRSFPGIRACDYSTVFMIEQNDWWSEARIFTADAWTDATQLLNASE